MNNIPFVTVVFDEYNPVVKEIEKHIPPVMEYYGIDNPPHINYISDIRSDRVAAVLYEDFSLEFNLPHIKSYCTSDCILNAITYLTPEQINDIRKNYITFIVAHEFCHLKQMRSRRIYLSPDKYNVIWAETGQTYRVPKTVEAYVELPWEKEANIEANNYIQMVKYE